MRVEEVGAVLEPAVVHRSVACDGDAEGRAVALGEGEAGWGRGNGGRLLDGESGGGAGHAAQRVGDAHGVEASVGGLRVLEGEG